MARSGGITVKGAPATAEQKRILSRALELAHRWNAPYKAKVALVEALIVESEAKNLRSTSADGYGSFGVLQGREAYHKRSDLLDPDYQVGVFLGKGRGGKKTGRKGFTGRGNAIGLSKSGMKSGDIAQAIEGSAYPDRYQGVQREAMRIVRELSPQFASNGVKAVGPTTLTLKGADTQQLDKAAYQKAKGQAVLGAFLKKRNPNNPLLKLGVVSTQDPNPADFVKTVKGKATKVSLPGAPTPKTGAQKVGDTFRGSPVPGQKAHGATHPTAGLAGFPAFDYMAKAGTAAVAPVSGKIIRLSGHDPKGGPTNGPHGPFGWSLYLKGDDGKTYFLTHMGTRTVKAGQRVSRGQRIGTVGNYAKYGGADHIHMGVQG